MLSLIANRSALKVAALVLALAALAVAPASATPSCNKVVWRVTLEATANSCGSAIGLCAKGNLFGNVRGTSDFVGTSFLPTVDTATTGVVVVTGDNVIHTSRGDVQTKDSIVLSTVGKGEFAEVDTVVGGTGDYLGATGVVTATGTFLNGVGEGITLGEICTQ